MKELGERGRGQGQGGEGEEDFDLSQIIKSSTNLKCPLQINLAMVGKVAVAIAKTLHLVFSCIYKSACLIVSSFDNDGDSVKIKIL